MAVEAAFLSFSPVGEGALAKARADEGSLSEDADPSSGTDFVRATFSHKGRRKQGPLPLTRQPCIIGKTS